MTKKEIAAILRKNAVQLKKSYTELAETQTIINRVLIHQRGTLTGLISLAGVLENDD